MSTAVNFLAFAAGWLGSVLGAGAGLPWVGALIVLMVAALHLSLVARPAPEALLMLLAFLIGLLVDSALMASGYLSYREGLLVPGLAPYWLVLMWVGFATTLNGSMRWLRGRPLLAMAFGFVSGPALYALGARFGALQMTQLLPALGLLAVTWALVMPLMSKLAEWLDGTTIPGEPNAATWITD